MDNTELGLLMTTDVAVGYVEGPPGVRAEIESLLKSAIPSKQFIQNLTVIKALAPSESSNLRIYNLPEAAQILREITDQLIMRHYRSVAE